MKSGAHKSVHYSNLHCLPDIIVPVRSANLARYRTGRFYPGPQPLTKRKFCDRIGPSCALCFEIAETAYRKISKIMSRIWFLRNEKRQSFLECNILRPFTILGRQNWKKFQANIIGSHRGPSKTAPIEPQDLFSTVRRVSGWFTSQIRLAVVYRITASKGQRSWEVHETPPTPFCGESR